MLPAFFSPSVAGEIWTLVERINQLQAELS
jgi:hypothetical protein